MDILNLYRSISTQNIPNNTWTTLIFDVLDLDSTFTGTSFSYDTTTGNITVKNNGFCQLNSQVTWAASGASIKAIRIIRNLDTNFPVFSTGNTSIAAAVFSDKISASLSVSAGDKLTVQVYQNTGGAINVLNVIDFGGGANLSRVTSLNLKTIYGPDFIF